MSGDKKEMVVTGAAGAGEGAGDREEADAGAGDNGTPVFFSLEVACAAASSEDVDEIDRLASLSCSNLAWYGSAKERFFVYSASQPEQAQYS